MAVSRYYLSWKKALNRKNVIFSKQEFDLLQHELTKKQKVFLVGFDGAAVKRTPIDDWYLLNSLYWT